MGDCCKCGQPIEADRVAWRAPTCSSCSAEGCGVQWLHGAPIRRCDNCDCMAPIDHAFGDVLEQLNPAARCSIGSCRRHGRCMYFNHPRCPDPPRAMFHVERPRIHGKLRIKL